MKKSKFVIIVLALVLIVSSVLCLSACDDDNNSDPEYEWIAGTFVKTNFWHNGMYVSEFAYEFSLNGGLITTVSGIVNNKYMSQSQYGKYLLAKDSEYIYFQLEDSENTATLHYCGTYIETDYDKFELDGQNSKGEFAGRIAILYYRSDSNGYIEGNRSQWIAKGGSGTSVTAVASLGYEFVKWSDGVTTAERTDTNLTANLDVTAEFRKIENTYILQYSAGENGKIEGETSQLVESEGNGSKVTAIADKGYEFVGWSDGVTTAERTDTNVTEDINVKAQFERIETSFTLRYLAGENGYIEGITSQQVARNANGAKVIAVPNYGYEFVGWSDGVASAERMDTNVTQHIEVTAIFKEKPVYTLQYIAGNNGTIQGYKVQEIPENENGSPVVAIPDEGYQFIGWSDGLATAERTDFNVTGNLTVTAQFKIRSDAEAHVLQYSASENGRIEGKTLQAVVAGGSGSRVTAIADSGYEFVGWSDGVTTAERRDTNVNGDINVTAYFTKIVKKYTLQYSAAENGKVTGELMQTVVENTNGSTVIAVPDEGYMFDKWSDGVTTAERTDLNVTGDINVTALFKVEEIYYTVTFDYGYDNITSQMRVLKDSKIELTTPSRLGYEFDVWTKSYYYQYNGGDTVEITDDITFRASWNIIEYTITYELNGGTLENPTTTFTINSLPLTLQTPEAENETDGFVEWTTDEQGENTISIIEKSEDNLKNYTLYAHYEYGVEFMTFSYNSYSNSCILEKYLGNAKKVIIPSSYKGFAVTAVSDSAFAYQRIKSITIPDSVTSIGDYAFLGCSGLEAVYITDIAKWCGISFDNEYANPLYYAHNLYLNGELVEGDLIIPSGTTEINSYVFYEYNKLANVVIPESVITIRGSAFYGCSGLTSITIPFVGAIKEGVNNTHFGYIFGASGWDENGNYIPKSLKDVIITGGDFIGDNAFSLCWWLMNITIPNSVTSIGNFAFLGCSGLTSVTMGSGVTSIGRDAFSGCKRLVEIYNKSSLKFVAGGNDYGYIGFYAKNIYTLENGSKLNTTDDGFVIYNYTEIVNYRGNESSITIPKSVNSISDYAFYGNNNLTNVVIPDSVMSIGSSAFYSCSELTSVTIGAGVTSIGSSVFANCPKLTTVYVDSATVANKTDHNLFDNAKDVYILDTVELDNSLFDNLYTAQEEPVVVDEKSYIHYVYKF